MARRTRLGTPTGLNDCSGPLRYDDTIRAGPTVESVVTAILHFTTIVPMNM
jgi:hypothetical protein